MLMKLGILCSIRDLGLEDKNGLVVNTRCSGRRYMEGVAQRLVKECRPGGLLGGLCEVVCVITDDRPCDLEGSFYATLPTKGKAWIHDLDLTDHHGKSLVERTKNIASSFRCLPRDAVAERRKEKKALESTFLAIMRQFDADVLLSDHYMCMVEHLQTDLGLAGRLLNVHPGITEAGHPFCLRGATPTADALKMAATGTETWTGATLHHIDGGEVDGGPIIYAAAPTRVYPDHTPEALRYENYQKAKLPVCVEGLRRYALETHPRLPALF